MGDGGWGMGDGGWGMGDVLPFTKISRLVIPIMYEYSPNVYIYKAARCL